MSEPQTDVVITLQLADPTASGGWRDEISIAAFATDPAYRAEVLRVYRAEGHQARMLRETIVTETLDE